MMIKCENIVKDFDNYGIITRALNGVNLTINKGEFVAIMGPSGCGKTSLLNIIGLLDNPSSGHIFFDSKNVTDYNEYKRLRLRKGRIGYIFQTFNLIDELTVYENIELPLIYLKIPYKERKFRVEQIMDKMKIAHRRNNYPLQLSGGQQQCVAIARAVVTNPEIILADEPTGNLDSESGENVMDMLASLNQSGTTVVIVTHSSFDAEKSNRIIHLLDGRIIDETIIHKKAYL